MDFIAGVLSVIFRKNLGELRRTTSRLEKKNILTI